MKPSLAIDILTLFPGMVRPVLDQSILGRAQAKGLVRFHLHDIREFAEGRHRVTDDAPYGGGAGMVLKPEPIFACIDRIVREAPGPRIMIPSPRGIRFNQDRAEELSRERRRVVFICGHYEGIDERVREGLDAEEFSIGDYILTGGELPVLLAVDAAVRLVPGVLGHPESGIEESFEGGILEYPHYTRPAHFRGMEVPEVLRSGDHGAITRWRRQQALMATYRNRPDLIEGAVRRRRLSPLDLQLLEEAKRREREEPRRPSTDLPDHC